MNERLFNVLILCTGIADPAAVEGGDEQKRRAFFRACVQLNRRIGQCASRPIDRLYRMPPQAKLLEIGRLRERGE